MILYLIFGSGGHTSNIIEIFETNDNGKAVGLINKSHPICEVYFGLPIVVNNAGMTNPPGSIITNEQTSFQRILTEQCQT